MKKITLRNKSRGASMVEYALLLVAVLLLAAAAIKSIGPKVSSAGTNAAGTL
jgi:Flp pilus assembly pilin Flp